MNDLRKAAEMALEALEFVEDDLAKPYSTAARKAIAALQAALEQPQPEPVAWRTFDGEGGYDYRTYDMNENYAREWIRNNPRHIGWVEPLYLAAPPQRKPLDLSGIVRLTYAIDEDRPATQDELIAFARSVEAAHGIGGDA